MIPIQSSIRAEASKGRISEADLPESILKALDAIGMWLGSGVLMVVEPQEGQSVSNPRKVVNSPSEMREILSGGLLANGPAKLHFNRVTSGRSGIGLVGAMGSGELEVVPDGYEFFKLSLSCDRFTRDDCHKFLDDVERVLGAFDKRQARFLNNYSA
jgi:hypothetical protein